MRLYSLSFGFLQGTRLLIWNVSFLENRLLFLFW